MIEYCMIEKLVGNFLTAFCEARVSSLSVAVTKLFRKVAVGGSASPIFEEKAELKGRFLYQ